MIHQGKHLRMVWVILALLALLVSRSAGATTSQTIHCGGWNIVPSPNPATYFNALYGVAAISPSDVWAVGDTGANGSLGQTLVEHWNGTSWKVVPSPNVEGGSALQGVTALAANNVWAVGDFDRVTQTLIEHWDGSQWSIVPSPSAGSYLNVLTSVSAVSARDIWAVGYYIKGGGDNYRTLIEHWDGAKWSTVASPNPGHAINRLYGVSAVSGTDAWAVGAANAPGPLVEHWDGTRWSLVHPPGRNGTYFTAVTAISASDVWAVGGYFFAARSEHWDGTRWRIVPTPRPVGDPPMAIAARSSTDVWAVGSHGPATFTMHWDGTSWQHIASPNKPSVDNYLTGVAVASAKKVWAVGYSQPSGGSTAKTLIEYYC